MHHMKPGGETHSGSLLCCSLFWQFLQVQDGSEPGNKVKAFYRLIDLPVIMVIDPITGLALRTWTGALEAHR